MGSWFFNLRHRLNWFLSYDFLPKDDVGMDEDVSETHTNGENGNGDSGAALKLTDDQVKD